MEMRDASPVSNNGDMIEVMDPLQCHPSPLKDFTASASGIFRLQGGARKRTGFSTWVVPWYMRLLYFLLCGLGVPSFLPSWVVEANSCIFIVRINGLLCI